MPRSPTSSEDEMAQSFSDSSEDSDSDTSREETIYDTIRATAEKPGSTRTEESQGNTLVIRILIEDLQQTVSCALVKPDLNSGCLWSLPAGPVRWSTCRAPIPPPPTPSCWSLLPLLLSAHPSLRWRCPGHPVHQAPATWRGRPSLGSIEISLTEAMCTANALACGLPAPLRALPLPLAPL